MLIPKANVEHFKHAFGRSISIQKHPNIPQKKLFSGNQKSIKKAYLCAFSV